MGLEITFRTVPGTATKFEVPEGSNLEALMSQANRSFKDGEVRVNGAKAEGSHALQAGDTVTQAKPPRGA